MSSSTHGLEVFLFFLAKLLVPTSDGVGVAFILYPYAVRDTAHTGEYMVSSRTVLVSATVAAKADDVVTKESLSDGPKYRREKSGGK